MRTWSWTNVYEALPTPSPPPAPGRRRQGWRLVEVESKPDVFLGPWGGMATVTPPDSPIFVKSSPLETHDLLLTHKIRPRWGEVTPLMRLHYVRPVLAD